MPMDYFDMVSRSQKIYGRCLEPAWKQWDITRNALDVLLFLANNPGMDRAVDIVQNRGISKSHVSVSVADLEKRGFLECRVDPKDRRTVHLILTEAAVPAVQAGREAQTRFFRSLHQGITEEEREIMLKYIRKTKENLTKMEENSFK